MAKEEIPMDDIMPDPCDGCEEDDCVGCTIFEKAIENIEGDEDDE